MSRLQYPARIGLLALLALGGVLSACGKQGVLEQPPPLFGSRARTEYEANKASEAAAAQRRNAAENGETTAEGEKSEEAPPSKRNVQDPAQKLTPASRAPITGAPNPFGSPISTTPGN